MAKHTYQIANSKEQIANSNLVKTMIIVIVTISAVLLERVQATEVVAVV